MEGIVVSAQQQHCTIVDLPKRRDDNEKKGRNGEEKRGEEKREKLREPVSVSARFGDFPGSNCPWDNLIE